MAEYVFAPPNVFPPKSLLTFIPNGKRRGEKWLAGCFTFGHMSTLWMF